MLSFAGSSQATLPSTRRGTRRALWSIALVAALTSAFYLWQFRGGFWYPDSASYVTPAKNLAEGRGFTAPVDALAGSPLAPEVFRTPGYPLFLSLFFALHLGIRSVIMFQHILRVLLITGVAAFAFQMTEKRIVPLTASLLMIVDFPLLELTNAILTELLFTIVMAFVYWLLWKESQSVEKPGAYALAAGLLAGFSVLIRPVSLFLVVPGVVFLGVMRPRCKTRSAVIFFLAFLCFPAAWSYRNYRAMGKFTVSTVMSYDALLYRAAGAQAMERPGNFVSNLEIVSRELESRACSELQKAAPRDCSRVPAAEKADLYSKLARHVVLQHPAGFLKMALRSAAIMMLDGGATTLAHFAGTSWHTGIRWLTLYTIPVLTLAVIGLRACWKMNRRLFWLAIVLIGYFVCVSSGPQANARFRVPVLPLYSLLSAFGLDSILNRGRFATQC